MCWRPVEFYASWALEPEGGAYGGAWAVTSLLPPHERRGAHYWMEASRPPTRRERADWATLVLHHMAQAMIALHGEGRRG